MLKGEDAIRAEIPDFDLLRLGEVRWLLVEFYRSEDDQRVQLADLVLNAVYHQDSSIYYLTIAFREVQQLALPELGGSWYQIGELNIDPVSDRGMERINYHVLDHLDAMSCYCRDVCFIELSRRKDDEREERVWKADVSAISRYHVG